MYRSWRKDCFIILALALSFGWVVKPSFGLSTPLVYRTLGPVTIAFERPQSVLNRILQGEICYFNDLEQASFRLSPELLMLRDRLAENAECVMMTGSGSALVCFGGDMPLLGKEYLVVLLDCEPYCRRVVYRAIGTGPLQVL